MAAPSDPKRAAHPTTQELPLVKPAGTSATRTKNGSPQRTGPVDYVAAASGAAPPTAQAPATAASTAHQAAARSGRPSARPAREPRGRGAATALALVLLSVVLLEVGLVLDFGTEPLWSAVPLWSAFASLCALVAQLSFVAF